MFVLQLSSRDLTSPPIKTLTGWSIGRSAIQPFRHVGLLAECAESASRTAFAVRERHNGSYQGVGHAGLMSESALDTYLRELRRWPLDFVCLVITKMAGRAEIKLLCGRWGTAPIYLLLRDQTLHAHWNIAALYDKLPGAKLDPIFAAKYLAELDHPYSRRTIFPHIHMLTERSTATCAPPFERVSIKYPPAETRAQAKNLKQGAKVTSMFREILLASMRSRILTEDQVVAIELSGGLDSTIVAAIASGLSEKEVRSYGMIMPGSDGGWQRLRREETVQRFGLIGRSFPATDYPPFGASSRRVTTDSLIPFGEFYDEAVGQLLDLAKSDGAEFIFTGLGGDELCTFQAGEQFGVTKKRIRMSSYPQTIRICPHCQCSHPTQPMPILMAWIASMMRPIHCCIGRPLNLRQRFPPYIFQKESYRSVRYAHQSLWNSVDACRFVGEMIGLLNARCLQRLDAPA